MHSLSKPLLLILIRTLLLLLKAHEFYFANWETDVVCIGVLKNTELKKTFKNKINLKWLRIARERSTQIRNYSESDSPVFTDGYVEMNM